jgi:hypothetical protein
MYFQNYGSEIIVSDTITNYEIPVIPKQGLIIDQIENPSGPGTTSMYTGSAYGKGQTFICRMNASVNQSQFMLKKTGSPTGTAVSKIYDVTGIIGQTAIPTGTALGTSDTFDVSTLTTTIGWYPFNFSTPVPLTYGKVYAVVIEYDGGNSVNYVSVGTDTNNSQGHEGNNLNQASSGVAWTAPISSGYDRAFKLFTNLNLNVDINDSEYRETSTLTDSVYIEKAIPPVHDVTFTESIGITEDFVYGDPYYNLQKISTVYPPTIFDESYFDAAYFDYGANSIGLSDSITIQRYAGGESGISVTDTITTSDSVEASSEQVLSATDEFILDDYINLDPLPYLDSFGFTDSVEISRVPRDFSISYTDTINNSDNLATSNYRDPRTSSDNITLQEDIDLINTIARNVSDTLSFTELVTIRSDAPLIKTTSDTANLTDSVYLTREGPASGLVDQDTIYILNGSVWTLFQSFNSFSIKKIQNQPSEFQINMSDIQDAEKAYVKEFAEVLFKSGNNLILKGRIQSIEYGSDYECTAKGFGMEVVLLDKELTKNSEVDPKRVQYTNYSAQDIAKELLATDPDNTAGTYIMPYASTGIFATDYGDATIRFEYANRLNALGALANAIGYEWWISQNYSDLYDVDTFNLASTRGSGSSVRTFLISGDNQNATQTSKEKDINSMANSITALGYGDGENQLKTEVYASSTVYSTLAGDITDTQTTITLASTNSFSSSGTINICGEIITYNSKIGNTLQGCTRGTSGSTAYSHKTGCYVEPYYTKTSPQSGSSISTYGLLETTQVDRSIRDRETLELVASKYLIKHISPIERIKVTPSEPTECVGAVEVGDLVTITDVESAISGSYRIVGIEYADEYGSLSMTIEVANVSLEFISQMQQERQNQQNLQKYMQGATNIYAVTMQENGNASYPLNLRFYVPDDAIAINKITVNFKMLPYRSYSSATSTEESLHTHAININAEPVSGSLSSLSFSGNQLYSTFGAGTIASTNTGSAHSHGISYQISEDPNYYTSPTPSVQIKAGPDGSENLINTYTSDQVDLDVTQHIINGWNNIKFTPNKAMRIEANVYAKVFIESN